MEFPYFEMEFSNRFPCSEIIISAIIAISAALKWVFLYLKWKKSHQNCPCYFASLTKIRYDYFFKCIFDYKSYKRFNSLKKIDLNIFCNQLYYSKHVISILLIYYNYATYTFKIALYHFCPPY